MFKVTVTTVEKDRVDIVDAVGLDASDGKYLVIHRECQEKTMFRHDCVLSVEVTHCSTTAEITGG